MGEVSQNPPVIEKIGKPPLIRRAKLGDKFLGFFLCFSEKFWGVFRFLIMIKCLMIKL